MDDHRQCLGHFNSLEISKEITQHIMTTKLLKASEVTVRVNQYFYTSIKT